ncbi:alpha/beta fold hydrolase [Pseudonocardia thermophila]|uniref:alpha/beta fold hydrolase n=1 Tax=Pseudonocardia thermophila TaxID=1848 RepID=UPI00248F10F5|nr:alpha/beta hydrolase [Pseudonocardia thermophila]
MQRRTVRTDDDVQLQIVEFGGSGAPILLLHGLMGRATTWWPVARWLVAHGRVLAPDARGHGRSQARGPWTTDRLVADVETVLEPLGPATVIGHSMGGLHALVLAARRPDLVRALIVEDIAVDFTDRSAADARAWFTALPQPFASLAHVREVFGVPRREFGDYMSECVEERADGYHLLAEVEHAVAIAAEWAQITHWAVLPQVRCPALLVEAEESVAPPGHMAEMARRMPDARHVRVPGTGHLVHAAAPETYRRHVEAFLSAVSRTPPPR